MSRLAEEHRAECGALRHAAEEQAKAAAHANAARLDAEANLGEARQQLQDSWIELKPT